MLLKQTDKVTTYTADFDLDNSTKVEHNGELANITYLEDIPSKGDVFSYWYSGNEVRGYELFFIKPITKHTKQGHKGDVGAKGPNGPCGVPGIKGDTGVPGETGDDGDRGYRGEQGPRGDAGPVGSKGEMGEDGKTGLVGPSGPTGFKGRVGKRGLQGQPGPQGRTGDKGSQGERGLVGPKGPQGRIGDKGETGNTGLDGFKGERGQQGPQGEDGVIGPRGRDGLSGEDGPKGKDGSLGKDGPHGLNTLVLPITENSRLILEARNPFRQIEHINTNTHFAIKKSTTLIVSSDCSLHLHRPVNDTVILIQPEKEITIVFNVTLLPLKAINVIDVDSCSITIKNRVELVYLTELKQWLIKA